MKNRVEIIGFAVALSLVAFMLWGNRHFDSASISTIAVNHNQ